MQRSSRCLVSKFFRPAISPRARRVSRWCYRIAAVASTSVWFSKATGSAARLFGDTREAARLKELIAEQTDVGPIRDQLLFDASAAA